VVVITTAPIDTPDDILHHLEYLYDRSGNRTIQREQPGQGSTTLEQTTYTSHSAEPLILGSSRGVGRPS